MVVVFGEEANVASTESVKGGERVYQYIFSDEFRERMARVSAESRPYDNSTPTSEVYRILSQPRGQQAQ